MHGHQLLINKISEMSELKGKNLIEIGTTREIVNGQDSSYMLSKLCDSMGMEFITVDMDSENTDNINERWSNENMNSIAITQKGEEFLKEYEGRIDFLYLDAFDFYHKEHSPKRIEKYKTILNTTINNEECHKMHLECCINSIDKINIGGYICVDDSFGENFDGKGKTAIPYLLDNGFIIDTMENKCILLKKVK